MAETLRRADDPDNAPGLASMALLMDTIALAGGETSDETQS